MVALNVVGHFRQQHDLRAYRRKLADEIGQDAILRVFPALAELPLSLVGPGGLPRTLGEALLASPRVALAGASGSGRRLALQQLALAWAAGDEAAPAPVLLALPRLDDGRSAPTDLITASLQAAGQVAEQRGPLNILQRLRLTRSDESDQRGRWLLLVSGWEELSLERRKLWRAALCEMSLGGPVAQLAVALPQEEPAWAGFAALTIVPPTPPLLAGWIERLVPAEHRAPITEVLDGRLRAFGERLFEAALLAWLAPWPELPPARSDLYARALARALDLPAGELPQAPAVAELQLLAAYNERPSRVFPGLLEQGADGGPHFVHAQMRRYLAARQLVDEGRLDLLQVLDPTERAEVALLVATTLDDPTPLYQALWRSGQLGAKEILTLGRCLRERAPHSATWSLRVIGALAQLVPGEDGPATRARELLIECAPALDACLEVAAADERARRFLLRLFELLPRDMALPRLERLAYAAVSEPFAWDLADLLVSWSAPEGYVAPALPAEPLARARWIFVHALRGPAHHQQLSPLTMTEALPTLVGSACGGARLLRIAVALLDNQALPPTTRQAALALVEASAQPSALTVIEHALVDEVAEIRAGALDALGRRDPDRAYAALSRAALDESTTWDVRLGAIRRLGAHLVRGAAPLLEHCAADLTLPLYARIRAALALGQDPTGTMHLLKVVGDARYHLEVRAAAARSAAAIGAAMAVEELCRLLLDPATPPTLAASICDGLAASAERVGVLLRVLDDAVYDVDLTLALVRAIGRAGGDQAIAPLSALLGAEALGRLQRGLAPRLFKQPAQACLDEPGFPQPIARRLAAALVGSPTPAERPTTLAEFLVGEADQVRIGTARVLVAIGGNTVRAALLAALLDGGSGGATAAIVDALAEVEGEASAEALGYLLGAEEVSSQTRWLIVQRLVDHPAGEQVMARGLVYERIDPFTRGALAEGLGQRGALAAIPLLRQIIEEPGVDGHLRSQAVLALGLLDDPATEAALLQLIHNEAEDTALRGMAAEYLPSTMSDEARRFLRDLLRRERPPAPIIAGALRALGWSLDREALPLLLRYCQDELTPVVQAAISALADLGDASVAPMLVRITQNPNFDHALRLQAVGTLLRIGGDSYRPLLRTYLEHSVLPLQLQALEHLIETTTKPDDLLALLADRSCPLTLRLRLNEHLAGAAGPALLHILEDDDDEIQLRCRAAETLARAGTTTARPAFIRLAERRGTASAVRLRCIGALGQIGGVESWLVLSHLAEDVTEMPVVRERAILALRHGWEGV